MEKNMSIRILQLKNNFLRDDINPNKEPLGPYCVIGYFDAFAISKEEAVDERNFNSWKCLGKLTSELAGNVNCRMLICFTEDSEKDRKFWEAQEEALFFITMIRLKKENICFKEQEKIKKKLDEAEKSISYWSYDHSEIIVVTKTKKYSDGIRKVMELREVCSALKMYTVFAMKEDILASYEKIENAIEDEKVSIRLHCMVKDYQKAGIFKKKLEDGLSQRNGRTIKIRKFETFGGYDWLMEVDQISIYSILEHYKMKRLLTHANEIYNEAFFNVESEILTQEEDDDAGVDSNSEEGTDNDI